MHSVIQKHIGALEVIFGETEGIISAYLFGSVADGVDNKLSDVDIAVLLRPGLSAIEKHRIRMYLTERIEQVLQKETDVVVLNNASLKMQHQVFSRGNPIYIKNEPMEEMFRLHKQKEYFDFQYYMEKERRDLRAFYDC